MFSEEDGYIIYKSRPRPSHILGICVYVHMHNVVKSFLNCMLSFPRIFAIVFRNILLVNSCNACVVIKIQKAIYERIWPHCDQVVWYVCLPPGGNLLCEFQPYLPHHRGPHHPCTEGLDIKIKILNIEVVSNASLRLSLSSFSPYPRVWQLLRYVVSFSNTFFILTWKKVTD